ncbi:MAG: aldehyde dehydrogenase family protein [Fibrobacteres bacterium]|nr:aldehyde dehydrogenase family protein [Fibrobacterota bacterium]
MIAMTNSAKTLRPVNPFTLEPAGEYPVLDFPGIRAAVAAARKAAQGWRAIGVGQRAEWVRTGLQYFEANRAAIAQDITRQMGKPIRQSENELKGFFERANWLTDAAEDVLAPELLPEKPGFLRRIEHVPLGVVLIIAPWNYPLLTAVNGVATALLAGNAVILKHSSLTPAVGEHFARAFGKLGPCEDLLQAILADHGDLGKAIAECDIDHVVFTGSVEGGRIVQRNAVSRSACANRFIDCSLELGGKDGAYVAADADVAKAAEDLVDGAMYNAGQSCCGIERVYVHKSLYQDFLSRAEVLVAGYVLGNPQEHKTGMGPLASAKSAQGMLDQVRAAKAKGARVVSGGQIKLIGKGTFFEPTLITGADNSMDVVREENFGPILPVIPVGDDDEAIRLVNDSPYGLTSAIYTSDVERADRFAAAADTGTVFMNRCDYLDPALPWTGVRDSGRGTTLSKFGFYSLTRRKAIHFRVG